MQQQGFTQGAGLRQQDYMNQLGLGGAQAGLAQGQMGLGSYQQGLAQLTPSLQRGDIGTLTDIGGIQQQQAQNVLSAQQQANQMAAMEPYQRMGVYGQGVSQLGQLPGQISTTQTADPTALQTALGTASVWGGIMNPNLGTRYNMPSQQPDVNALVASSQPVGSGSPYVGPDMLDRSGLGTYGSNPTYGPYTPQGGGWYPGVT
jgi:hypothetical protein